MNAPDEKVLRAIVNLSAADDFNTLHEWIAESYDSRLKENSDILDEAKMRWGQGRAQQLLDLLTTIENAKKLLSLTRK